MEINVIANVDLRGEDFVDGATTDPENALHNVTFKGKKCDFGLDRTGWGVPVGFSYPSSLDLSSGELKVSYDQHYGSFDGRMFYGPLNGQKVQRQILELSGKDDSVQVVQTSVMFELERLFKKTIGRFEVKDVRIEAVHFSRSILSTSANFCSQYRDWMDKYIGAAAKSVTGKPAMEADYLALLQGSRVNVDDSLVYGKRALDMLKANEGKIRVRNRVPKKR